MKTKTAFNWGDKVAVSTSGLENEPGVIVKVWDELTIGYQVCLESDRCFVYCRKDDLAHLVESDG